MTNTLTSADVLANAADLVETSGRWVNRNPRPAEICAVTALGEVGLEAWGLSFILRPLWWRALRCLGREIGTGVRRIPAWNDAQDNPVVVAATMRDSKRWLSAKAGA